MPGAGWARAIRWVKRARGAFPETRPAKLPGKMRALERRRAKNRVARASRKRNRR